MSIHINKEAYQKLIKEDVIWLIQNTERNLERDHILDILKDSVDRLYPYKGSEDDEFIEWWKVNVDYSGIERMYNLNKNV